MQLHEFA